MELAINIGNSSVQFAIRNNNSYTVEKKSIAYMLENSSKFIEEICNNNNLTKIIICSVNPIVAKVMKEDFNNFANIEPYYVSYDDNYDIDFSSYESNKLGLDRIVCCQAAQLSNKTPFIMIDFGTATTINYVNSNNEFVGGMIMPSIKMSLECMNQRIPTLPKIDLDETIDIKLLETSSTNSIVSGVVNGFGLQIDSIINEIWQDNKTKGQVIITGGNAKYIMDKLKSEYIYKPTLIIDGLFSILDNKDQE